MGVGLFYILVTTGSFPDRGAVLANAVSRDQGTSFLIHLTSIFPSTSPE